MPNKPLRKLEAHKLFSEKTLEEVGGVFESGGV